MLGTGKGCGSRKNRTQVQLLVRKKKKKVSGYDWDETGNAIPGNLGNFLECSVFKDCLTINQYCLSYYAE